MSVFKGDNGTDIEVRILDEDGVVDLTDATTVVAHFVKSDDSTFDKTMTISSASEGVCTTSLTSDDLSVAGRYRFQMEITFDSGSIFHSDVQKITVVDTI